MNHQLITDQKDYVRFPRHVWFDFDDPAFDPCDSNPIVGYGYQDFAEGHLKVSCMRPSDAEVIEEELSKGKYLSPGFILHFTDHHKELLESILSSGRVCQFSGDPHHLVDVALMQVEAGNEETTLAICCHLMRHGWLKETFKAKARNGQVLSKPYAKELFEKLSPIIDEAGHIVFGEQLEKKLIAKPEKSKKKKV